MFRRDIVRSTFDQFAADGGLTRKAKSWYRRTDETIVVLTLVRLPYGHQYSMHFGVVLRALDADEAPRDKDCQFRSRFDRLVPSTLEHGLNDLFDLGFPLADSARRDELLALLRSHLLPLVDAASTLEGLRSGLGRRVVRGSQVSDPVALGLVTTPTAYETDG